MADVLLVYNQNGEKTGQVSLKEKFLSREFNPDLLHKVTVAYQANKRQGNASTKTRGKVSGGGRKPWRQKGTGRARVGSSRSPIWTGGGTVFGPMPRDYRVRLPKKIRSEAIFMALKNKIELGALLLLDEFKIAGHKTKQVRQVLKALGVEEKKILLLIDKADNNTKLAVRNIKGLSLKEAGECNALDIMLADKIVADREAFEKF